MSDVLSQSQIDMLLNSMREGSSEPAKQEKKEKEYKKYDFYSPKKFTRERLKILKTIHDNYCRIIVSHLNGILRMNCEIEVISVEEQRYHEFSNSLGENDVIELFYMKLPEDLKNPPVVFHISQLLMTNMIDRLLGGEGDEAELAPDYTYTDIELALYEKILGYFSGAIRDSWKNYISLTVGSRRLEQSPTMFQEIGMDETVAIIMLKMSIPNASGYISICIPGNLLTNVFAIVDKRRHVEGAYENMIANGRDIIMQKLRDSALDMKVELGTAKLSFQDIYGLRVDDVIDLSKSKNSNVKVFVANEPWFDGKLGVHKNSVAVKLDSRLIQEDELEQEREVGQFEEELAQEVTAE